MKEIGPMDKITKKSGDFPVNAITHINYSETDEKGNPTIKFEYPDNERQLKSLPDLGVVGYSAVLLALITLIALWYAVYVNIPLPKPDCIIAANSDSFSILNITINQSHIDSNGLLIQTPGPPTIKYFNVSGFAAACTNGGYIFTQRKNPIIFIPEWNVYNFDSDWSTPFYLIGGAIVTLVLFFLFYKIYGKIFALFVRKNKYARDRFPTWNKWIYNKHFSAEFTECPDNLKIELPLFKNIYMDYDAEEEFADYLIKVDIVPHDVKYLKGRKKKKEKLPNVYLWKCIFTFSQKPTKGVLKVNFT
jgi:hypothetical protein